MSAKKSTPPPPPAFPSQPTATTQWRMIGQSDIDAVGSNLPYRITEPGFYCLSEDITVRSHSNYEKMDNDEIRARFAVIAIACDGVHFDLDGHIISMTEITADRVLEGASLIELGSTPYPTGVFPKSFPDPHVPANYVVVRNGILASTGHFGIHGMGNKSVLLEDLTISRVGVGGITLSQVVSDITLRRVRVTGTTLPLRATLQDLAMIEMERSQKRFKVPNGDVGNSTVPDGSLITGIHINGEFTVQGQPTTLPDKHGKGILIDGCSVSNIIGKTNDYGSYLTDDRKIRKTSTGIILQPPFLCPHLSKLGELQLKELGLNKPESISSLYTQCGMDIRGHFLKAWVIR